METLRGLFGMPGDAAAAAEVPTGGIDPDNIHVFEDPAPAAAAPDAAPAAASAATAEKPTTRAAAAAAAQPKAEGAKHNAPKADAAKPAPKPKAGQPAWAKAADDKRKAEAQKKKEAEKEMRDRWTKKAAAEKAAADREKKNREQQEARRREQQPKGNAGAKKPAGAQDKENGGANRPGGGARPPPGAKPRPAAKPATRAQPGRKAKPLRPEQRAEAALEPIRAAMRKGNQEEAYKALQAARVIADKDPSLPLTEAMLDDMREQIESLPPAAQQVLKYASFSPFSALGVERLAQARVLNTVNKRNLLKNYRRLALKLHPDKCEHPVATDAMQALNVAYDKITIPPKPKTQAAYGARGRPGPRRR